MLGVVWWVGVLVNLMLVFVRDGDGIEPRRRGAHRDETTENPDNETISFTAFYMPGNEESTHTLTPLCRFSVLSAPPRFLKPMCLSPTHHYQPQPQHPRRLEHSIKGFPGSPLQNLTVSSSGTHSRLLVSRQLNFVTFASTVKAVRRGVVEFVRVGS